MGEREEATAARVPSDPDEKSLFIYSVAFEVLVKDKYVVSGEIVCGKGDDSKNSLILFLGANTEIFNNLKLDAGFGIGLNRASPKLRITFGFTYEFFTGSVLDEIYEMQDGRQG